MFGFCFVFNFHYFCFDSWIINSIFSISNWVNSPEATFFIVDFCIVIRKHDLLYGFLSICWSLFCGLSSTWSLFGRCSVCARRDWMSVCCLLGAGFSVYMHHVRIMNCIVRILCALLAFVLLSYQLLRWCVKISHYDHAFVDL